MPTSEPEISFHLLKVVFKTLYPKDYTSVVSTRVSNSLLVGKDHLFRFTTRASARIIQVLSLDKLLSELYVIE